MACLCNAKTFLCKVPPSGLMKLLQHLAGLQQRRVQLGQHQHHHGDDLANAGQEIRQGQVSGMRDSNRGPRRRTILSHGFALSPFKGFYEALP